MHTRVRNTDGIWVKEPDHPKQIPAAQNLARVSIAEKRVNQVLTARSIDRAHHGTCPREEPPTSSFLLLFCSLFSDALGYLPQVTYTFGFPRPREW